MRFTDEFLRALRERVSIAEFAGKRLAWDRKKSIPAKGEYWACCPFHGEKTASFHIRDRQQTFYCFGCHAKGDVIGLAMQLDGLSFPEAVERLAGFAGMALPEQPDADRGAAERRQRLLHVLRAAADLYQKSLFSEPGTEARRYLEQRGLDVETCRRFAIGFAPNEWTFAIDRLKTAGFALEDILACGLGKASDGRRPIDFFRNRILFPITDMQGRVIAFGGRALDKDNPAKYLNSPETPTFHKGASLYRAADARKRLSQDKSAVLVAAEGYLDVIALERAGFAAVAPLGTALTADQLTQLWKLHAEPVLCFDGDTAGQRAADRALDLALPRLGPDHTARIALLPLGQDPDDVFRSQGPDALRAVIAAAVPAVERLFAREAAGPLDTPERMASLRKRLRMLAEQVEDRETRSLYTQALLAKADAMLAASRARRPAFETGPRAKGRRLGYPPPDIQAREELKDMARRQLAQRQSPAAALERLLQQGLRFPNALSWGADQIANLAVEDAGLDQIRHAMLDLLAAGIAVDQTTLSNHLASVGHTAGQAKVVSWPSLSAEGDPGAQSAAEWLALLEQAASERVIEEEFRAVADPAQAELDVLTRAKQLAAERAALLQRTLASRRDG